MLYFKKETEVYYMDKWDKRFVELSQVIAGWSSCYKENRQIGAVIVKNKRILTTGYNGRAVWHTQLQGKGRMSKTKIGDSLWKTAGDLLCHTC